jgi:hypothetical protein
MFATVSSLLTWGFSPRRKAQTSPAQLPLPQPPAHPGTGQCRHDQRQRIPVRPIHRSAVPRKNRANNAHHKAKNPRYHRVPHWPVRRQPRRHITAQDAKDHSIQRSQRQRTTACRLPRRRKDSQRIQRQIRPECQRNRDHNPGNHRANTPTKSSRRAHSPPRSHHPSCNNSQSYRYSAEGPLRQAQKRSELRKT